MKNCAILIMAFAFCITNLHAKNAKENALKIKDSIAIPKTFEDRIVTKADYTNDTLRKFYDLNWKETAAYNASYYSVAYKKGENWICYDYYIPENKIFQYVPFTDQALKNKQGLFVSYTPNGKLDEFGYYNNNLKSGNWLYFKNRTAIPDTIVYLNGMQTGRSLMHYSDDKILSIQELDTTGNGIGKRTEYFDDDKSTIQQTGRYSKGQKKDSSWVYYYPNGKVSFLEKYNKGSLQTTSCYDINGKTLDSCITEQMPMYPGGLPEMFKFLADNIKYPPQARENNIQGRVIIQFFVDKDGSITNVVVKRDIGGSCGAEAARVVALMPRWNPGIQYGNPVKVYYTLPVSFKLGF